MAMKAQKAEQLDSEAKKRKPEDDQECETEVEHVKVCKDAYTGVVLDSAAVGEARNQELEFAASLKAWEP